MTARALQTAAQRGQRSCSSASVECIQQRGHLYAPRRAPMRAGRGRRSRCRSRSRIGVVVGNGDVRDDEEGEVHAFMVSRAFAAAGSTGAEGDMRLERFADALVRAGLLPARR